MLDNIQAIFGLHIAHNIPLGEVAARPGPMLAGSGFFEAVISGKGGHAAIPQHSIDPLLAASNVIVSLQHLVSREADPLDSQVSNLECLNVPFGVILTLSKSFLSTTFSYIVLSCITLVLFTRKCAGSNSC